MELARSCGLISTLEERGGGGRGKTGESEERGEGRGGRKQEERGGKEGEIQGERRREREGEMERQEGEKGSFKEFTPQAKPP